MASIIRANSDRPSPAGSDVRGVAFEFKDMSHRADAYIQQVRDEAAKIVQQAHADAAKVRRDAEQAGRTAAEEAIERVLAERVGKQLQTLRPAIDGIVKQLDATRGEWLDHWQRAAVQLAVAIAERLVGKELSAAPEISEQWVREALSLAAGSGEITVKLNPQDFAHLSVKAEELAQSIGVLAAAKFVPHESVTAGGCLVETRYGSVDMRLETQLARLAEELN